jgi:sugar transferase (PEP-CTERM/EpsH1 system associated)
MTAGAAPRADPRPLIAHVVYRMATGGLENGVVNLINHLPGERYRHAVIALTEVTGFRDRIERRDVQFVQLDKRPGPGVVLFPRLYRTFRTLAPAIVHTRNLAALEASLPAFLAGVPARIHGEHGRDIDDLDGSSSRYRFVRRVYRPFVHHYVAVSRDLERYLAGPIGVRPASISQIYNGVDTLRFAPAPQRADIPGCPFDAADRWVVGTVGRLQAVKDQTNLATAFVRAARAPGGERLRLVIAGDGPLRDTVERVLREGGVADRAWLTGERDDVPTILRGLDCFVLPSLAEGVANTILEAMACGLPVVATRVGGNGELVDDDVTGRLVPAADPPALADALLAYAGEPATARAHGRRARERVLQRFSIERMVADYGALYDGLCARRIAASATTPDLRVSAGRR